MKQLLVFPARLIKWLQSKFRRQFDLRDFIAQTGIKALGPCAFDAQSDDPSFYLGVTLEPGCYLISLKARVPHIDTQSVHARAQFFLDDGLGESEERSWLLPFRSNEKASGTITVAKRSRLRFDPIEHGGVFDIANLTVKRLRPSEAPTQKAPPLVPPATQAPTAITTYAQWLSMRHEFRPTDERTAPARPSVVVLIIDGLQDPLLADRSIRSVLSQQGGPWELHHLHIRADNASPTAPSSSAGYQVHAIETPNKATTVRKILNRSPAQTVLMLIAGDTLPKQALQHFAQAQASNPDAALIYGDQDFTDAFGFRNNPYFKPDWSPDLFYSYNYLGRAVALNKALLLTNTSFATPDEAAPWHALLCSLSTQSGPIVHLPCILYHQAHQAREASTVHDLAQAVGSTSVSTTLSSIIATKESRSLTVQDDSQRLVWGAFDNESLPLASIIIPTRDGFPLLSRCIESLGRVTVYPRIELIVVDNGSTCPKTLALLRQVSANQLGIAGLSSQTVQYDAPFNYSAINNRAVSAAHGEVLVFLNNDIEVTHEDWLFELVQHAARPSIGCVGAQLLFPNGNIQHAGIVLGLGGVAGHVHRGDPADSPGYFERLTRVQNVSAVTGAAMAIRKTLFQDLGGFDEGALAVAYNDVDLCLKAVREGYRNIVTPHAVLLHHESASRGSDTQPAKRKRLEVEERTMYERWGPVIARDPCFNPNLSLRREDVQLSEVESNACNP